MLVLSKWITSAFRVLDRYAQDAFHVRAIARVHEVDSLAVSLIVVEDGLAQIIGHKPVFGIRLVRRERFRKAMVLPI